MTSTQLRALRLFVDRGRVLASEIPVLTRRSLTRRGWLKEKESFGLEGVVLTPAGRRLAAVLLEKELEDTRGRTSNWTQ